MFGSGRTLGAVKARLKFGNLPFDCTFHVVKNSEQIPSMGILGNGFLQHL